MRDDVKLVRGLGLALVAAFLVAGAAFAADGLTRTPDAPPAAVTPVVPAATAQPTPTPEPPEPVLGFGAQDLAGLVGNGFEPQPVPDPTDADEIGEDATETPDATDDEIEDETETSDATADDGDD